MYPARTHKEKIMKMLLNEEDIRQAVAAYVGKKLNRDIDPKEVELRTECDENLTDPLEARVTYKE